MLEDPFYRCVTFAGRRVFDLCSRSVVLHPERGAQAGGMLLAANHLSPYDIPCLMKATRRRLDFVSIVEVFENPFVGWLYGSLGAMPLDRHNPDRVTVREIVRRLKAGRAVAIFPEGGLRDPAGSVLSSGSYRPGFGQMAVMAGVPVVPCVVLGSANFTGVTPWLPLRRTRWAIAYGAPLSAPLRDAAGAPLGRARARELLEERWLEALLLLRDELATALEARGWGDLVVR